MLSKEKCIHAIINWGKTKSNYTKIKKMILPTATFNLSQKDCMWLNENNDNSKFHTYIGDHNNQLILIVVPLHKNGKEVELSSYLTSTLSVLSTDLTLVETEVKTTTKRTTLSKDLKVINYSEEITFPTYNEPTILERASVNDIEQWKNDCLDWFYFECNYHNGKRIFSTFIVPFSDLVKENQEYYEVNIFFGFKESSLYQRTIPVLIFVSTDCNTNHSEIIRTTGLDTELSTNTKDWSQPCPPLCKDIEDFNLLG